jgi:Flp pilus assembly protein TadD
MGGAYGTNEPDLSAAFLALREDHLDAAEAIVRRLFENKPDDPAVHQLAAIIALRRGEFQQAAHSAAASHSTGGIRWKNRISRRAHQLK